MPAPPSDGFLGVLETVLYYSQEEEEAMERFYGRLLGLPAVGARRGRFLFFRVSPRSVLLLFDRSQAIRQEHPPPHGSEGPGHACLLAVPARYEQWRQYVESAGIAVEGESEWPGGGRSFYFRDPAGNVLEIADRDIWPEP